MSMYCYCNDCLAWGKTQKKLDECESPVTLDQMLAEEMQIQEEEETPVCPGYETATVVEDCGVRLPYGQSICSDCVKRRHQQEILEDEAVEAYLARQLDLEEAQLLALEDDVESDEDTDEDQNDLQKRAYRLPEWKL